QQHQRIAMQLLSLKAIQGYSSVFYYETHILPRSMYHQTKKGVLPISPANFIGQCHVLLAVTILFATWTGSTLDPLTEHVLAITTELM
ncbi:hypothetical protein F5148DRAFT_946598, partial [Russula earlei]